jgi:hypothetical protein
LNWGVTKLEFAEAFVSFDEAIVRITDRAGGGTVFVIGNSLRCGETSSSSSGSREETTAGDGREDRDRWVGVGHGGFLWKAWRKLGSWEVGKLEVRS